MKYFYIAIIFLMGAFSCSVPLAFGAINGNIAELILGIVGIIGCLLLFMFFSEKAINE